VVPKATLVDWIWGEQPPADATNALYRLVSRLRKVLPEGSVEGQTDGYRLTVEPDAVDAVRFERLITASKVGRDDDLRRVRLLREALGLWRGAAMQDIDLPDSSAFDAAVTRLGQLRLTALEDRFDVEVRLGHGAELVTELTDVVAAQPVRERLVAALMRALAAAGRGSEALLVYQRTREALADALGADPSPELSALHVALLRGDVARREEDRKTNLRAELTSFVGKDADVAAVRELIADHRLTTLIGTGGSGKTRLATETARTLLGDLPGGTWLVELAVIGAGAEPLAERGSAGVARAEPLAGRGPLHHGRARLSDRAAFPSLMRDLNSGHSISGVWVQAEACRRLSRMRVRRAMSWSSSRALSAIRSRNSASSGLATRKRAICAKVKLAACAQLMSAIRSMTSGPNVRRKPLRPLDRISPRRS
jgi:DNA-binding SARP family transcriptional activator